MPLACDIPDVVKVEHDPNCRCCGPLAPALWGVYGALRATGCTDVVQRMKDDGAEDDPDARPEEDPTLTEELLLAAIIAASVALITKKALDRFWRAISRNFSPEAVSRALDRAIQSAAKPLTRSQEREIDRILERAMSNGALDARADETAPPESRVSQRPERTTPAATGRLTARLIGQGTALETDDRSALAWQSLSRVVRGSTGTFFEDVVAPTIRRQLQPILEQAAEAASRGEDYTPDFAEVRALVDAQADQTSRWRVTANAAVSRAYHYGFLRTSELTGIFSYTWVTVGDERVCPICSELSGKVFKVRDALDAMDRIAESDDPEAAKKVLPWPKSVEDLRSRDMMIPPAHGRCRCTIRIRRVQVPVP